MKRNLTTLALLALGTFSQLSHADSCPTKASMTTASKLGYESFGQATPLSDGSVAIIAYKKIRSNQRFVQDQDIYDLLVLDAKSLQPVRNIRIKGTNHLGILEKKDGTLTVLSGYWNEVQEKQEITPDDTITIENADSTNYKVLPNAGFTKDVFPLSSEENTDVISSNSSANFEKMFHTFSNSNLNLKWEKSSVDANDNTIAATSYEPIGFNIFDENKSLKATVDVQKITGPLASRIGNILHIHRPLFTNDGLINVTTNKTTAHFFKKDGEHVSSFQLPGQGSITAEPRMMGNGKVAIPVGGANYRFFSKEFSESRPEIHFFNSNGSIHSSIKLDTKETFRNSSPAIWSENDQSVILTSYDKLHKVQFSESTEACDASAKKLKLPKNK